MRIPIASFKMYDWQGPTTGVRLRITADESFLARENDGTGVEVDGLPKVFREVDCIVGTELVDGINVKTITVPALWLYSTNDAIVGKVNARYTAKFVTKAGQEIKPLDLLQSFKLPVELIGVFNPVPWYEIIRFNFPAAPVPMNFETYSQEQILDLIGDSGIIKGGNAASPRVAFWSGPITVDGATGFEYQNADGMLKLVQQNPAWNAFRISESAAAANVKVGGSPALFSTHLINETGVWHRGIVNDAATRRWAEIVRDGALGLQYNAYDNADALQGRTIFDPAGGVGVSDTAADFGYFYKSSAAYHLGINAAGAGIGGATPAITFTANGVGINKPTAIGSQLHVLSGDNGRIGLLVDTAGAPTQPIAVFRNNASQRFAFDQDGVATFGLPNSVKGRLNFAAAANANIHSIEAPDTPAGNVRYKLPAASPAAGQLLRTLTFTGGVATLEWVNPIAGGDVSSDIGTTVDNRLTRFQGTTGKLITDSAVVVADTTGSFTVPDAWGVTSAGGSAINLNASNLVFTAPAFADPVDGFSFSQGSQTQGNGELSRTVRIASTYNQTGTALSTTMALVRVETALGSGQHSFIQGFGGASGSTLRFRIDNLGNYHFGALTGQFIGDSNGNELLRFDGVVSAVNQITIANATAGNPPALSVTGDDTNIDLLLAPKGTGSIKTINHSIEVVRTAGNSGFGYLITNPAAPVSLRMTINDSGTFFLSIPNITDIFTVDLMTARAVTFSQIPILPASNPTTANQAVRKDYVDTRRSYFTLVWYVEDPSTHPLSSNTVPIWSAPALGGTHVATRFGVLWSAGTHNSGTSVTFHLVVNGGLTGHTVTLNDSTPSFTGHYNDFSNISPMNNAWFHITARSGTIAERAVSIYVEGYKNLQA